MHLEVQIDDVVGVVSDVWFIAVEPQLNLWTKKHGGDEWAETTNVVVIFSSRLWNRRGRGTSQPATSGRFFSRSALYFQQNWTTSTGMARPLPPKPSTSCTQVGNTRNKSSASK